MLYFIFVYLILRLSLTALRIPSVPDMTQLIRVVPKFWQHTGLMKEFIVEQTRAKFIRGEKTKEAAALSARLSGCTDTTEGPSA